MLYLNKKNLAYVVIIVVIVRLPKVVCILSVVLSFIVLYSVAMRLFSQPRAREEKLPPQNRTFQPLFILCCARVKIFKNFVRARAYQIREKKRERERKKERKEAIALEHVAARTLLLLLFSFALSFLNARALSREKEKDKNEFLQRRRDGDGLGAVRCHG